MNIHDYKTEMKVRSPKIGGKYGNIHTEYNGVVYMSRKEAAYACQLDDLKLAVLDRERVVSYETQVPYQITMNGHDICKYLLDFRVTYADGHVEHVDVKGFDKKSGKFVSTDVFKIKKKLIYAQYGIDILEK